MIVHGTDIPALGFGTWRLAGDAAIEGVRDALQLGYRHIDTARLYDNEREVGEGIRSSGVPRAQVFLVTKIGRDECVPERVMPAIDDSLRKLGTHTLDLLLIHWPNPDVPLAETLGVMKRAQEQGKVQHLGVSNFPSALVDEARRHATIVMNQVECHPYLQQRTLLRKSQGEEWCLCAYSPIARGKVLEDPVVVEIAAAHRAEPAQVVLRWLLQRGSTAAIPKASSHAHRKSNLGALDLTLSNDAMAAIDALDRGERIINPASAPVWDDEPRTASSP